MIVKGGTTFLRALRDDWPTLLFFLLLALTAEWVYIFFPLQHTALPNFPMGLLITAMSIFLAFQVNQSYDRWWEARNLWGRLVNTSRTLGRQATTLLGEGRVAALADADARRSAQRDVVYRHIAYVHALRLSLRFGPLDEDDWRFLGGYLDEAEIGGLRRAANVPAQLVQNQGRKLAGLLGTDFAEQQILLALDATLTQLCDIQGGCERIKRQSFPDRFSFHTRAFVWLLAMLLPFHLFQNVEFFDFFAIVTETLLSFLFVTIDRLGRELRDPFENRDNDTPMTALSRTIEIDLRQQLGETRVPPPLEPVDGVLL
jgi:putative membrane protein